MAHQLKEIVLQSRQFLGDGQGRIPSAEDLRVLRAVAQEKVKRARSCQLSPVRPPFGPYSKRMKVVVGSRDVQG